ncbi:3-[(3aS,4S,7aS)-7a-methyl-1,5-dioxo-octahydro-1H-inden-4-yl]propanoyl:CoA ligase [Mycobacterium talmoniae]|uniref:Long-chain-fatty-acid--CoA ligase FadD13 n=2 Tax=Mycobacterium talmoniae TaxID=1858794 RepID=A0A1S1NHZ1_9MYCO|nr:MULTISPECIES: AMP-binding protein [Mycobacterium]OHV00013.1 AMP-binding protein [Mycobacterium talmoniae]PQM45062.1 3-[(3aS,4S,7aS)-7a-methyl-1,5-dioxo-octahydro-1H-inden-4-yl]propanoyl:CoA ligase [Mycobacterium talmoniae]TDH56048.1 AMP-binding protein [Mycobacterium eburneum]
MGDSVPSSGRESYARGENEPPLLEMTIGANLADTAARFPDRDALVDVPAQRCWSYAELLADVRRLASGLLRAGIGPGDRVGIWAPNCAEWVLVQYATAEIGAILVTINPAYLAHELRFALQQSGVVMVIAATGFKASDYVELLGEVAPRCPDLREVVFVDSKRWAELAGAEVDPPTLAGIAAMLHANDPINIQYTSGTTGHPKGATLSHRNILNNGYLVGELLGYTEADRICIPVPFYHCFGMVLGNLAATSHGAAIVIPAASFDAAATLRAVQDQRCTSLYGVPTMFIAELNLPNFADYDLTSLRTGIMAGSPCPEAVIRAAIERMHMPGVAICYGMTETSPVSLQTRAGDPVARRVSTVGRVCPHLEIKVVDPATGETVPHGATGELYVRGYSVMAGYWKEPERTAETIDADGWMHTGDLAIMDDDGYVQIAGRIKDMVIRGGENISPREIEEFLHTHPDIRDAQVIGVPDEKYGEELMAVVTLRTGAPELTIQALRQFCAHRLAYFKIPRYLRVVDEFPMTVTGKVRKVDVRRQAIEYLSG